MIGQSHGIQDVIMAVFQIGQASDGVIQAFWSEKDPVDPPGILIDHVIETGSVCQALQQERCQLGKGGPQFEDLIGMPPLFQFSVTVLAPGK